MKRVFSGIFIYARENITYEQDRKMSLVEKIMKLSKSEADILTNLFSIVKICMEHVEETQHLNGAQKKALVIETIHQIIDTSGGPLDAFDSILKPLISGAIEEFISIDKKGFRLKTKKCKGLCGFILNCFSCRPCARCACGRCNGRT